MSVRHARSLALFVFAITLAACSGGGGGGSTPGTQPGGTSPTSTPTNAPAPNVVPSGNSIYLGAFVNTSGAKPPLATDLTAFETQIGRTLALTIHYYGFTDTFPGTPEALDAGAGRIPIESWNCGYPDSYIASGGADAVIRQRADAFRAYAKPIFLRYMWEMNIPSSTTNRPLCYDSLTDDPNGYFSATQFIAAWDHIRAIFIEEGATNVIWLWNPSGTAGAIAYYPGASQTDWVGFDKYDVSGASFSSTFASTYAAYVALGQPMLIGETGATSTVQPAFLASAASTLSTQYPLVKGFVYFDAVGTQGTWLLSTSGISAFAAMAADPYFAAKPPN